MTIWRTSHSSGQRDEAGFTLPEVLVATALLIGAVVTLALVMARAGSTNTLSRRTTYATLLATEKLEHLRALPVDDAELAGTTADTLSEDCDGYFDEPAPGFRRRWCITPLTSPAGAVVITVAVLSGDSSPRAVLTTLKVRRAA